MKTVAFARRNHLGYWVGCLRHSDGTTCVVTNAFHDEGRAREIAERLAGHADERLAPSKPTPTVHPN